MIGTNIVAWLLVANVMSVAVAKDDARESRIVQTTQGSVKGYKSDDGNFFQFFGIPYATAPTGARRFTAPLPGPIWMTTFEAVEQNIMCPQKLLPLLFNPNMKIQENCLIVNIHVPATDKNNLPVYVYVHGGGYMLGYGGIGNVHTLAKSKKFITVTFNYRVGAHGFLCLGTEDAPGNAGMKDQVALLRWLQKNIGNFGGNPNDVTLAGGSAGSSSVDLIMLSDIARGLFQRVIPESGASLSPWSIQVDPIEYARDFARLKNFSNIHDFFALENYYKSAPFEEIVSEILIRSDSSIPFTPCVERDVGQEMFLSEAPITILKQGKFRKVPVLNGFANMEGIMMVPEFETRKDKMNERFADFLPPDLQFSSEQEKEEVAKLVKEFYFADKPVSEDTIQGYIDYFSDVMFGYGHLRTVNLQVEAGSDSIYLYEYSFYSPPPQGHYPDFMSNVRGATHGAQAFAVYDVDLAEMFVNDDSIEYKKMREALKEIWNNFITTGKPVPEGSKLPAWLPVGENRSPYMEFGKEIKLKGPLLEKRARIWDQIYEKHSRVPHFTTSD